MTEGKTLRIALVLLTTAGLGVAGYLTYVHYAGISPVCTTGGSCEKVQTSAYSQLLGIPVALIGLLGYATILATLLARETETTRLIVTALTLTGFAFSAYLTALRDAVREQPWLAGETFTVADILCASMIGNAFNRELLTEEGPLRDWALRAQRRPANLRAEDRDRQARQPA